MTASEQLGLSVSRLARVANWLDQLVEDGYLTGSSVLISRHGRRAWFHASGRLNLEKPDPIQEDTIFRIYSMTKPVTSVAAMILYERGLFHLDDPVASFLPEFADMSVYDGGEGASMALQKARSPLTVRHLLTHTSGLAHPLMGDTPVHRLYREQGVDFGKGVGSLESMTKKVSALPLLFHPGARWGYGVSTDVLGRMIEVVSGKSLDEFFQREIFGPLGMKDTAFQVAPQSINRFASLYTLSDDSLTSSHTVKPSAKPQSEGPRKLVEIDPAVNGRFSTPVTLFSGGGGLTSTIADYYQFALMLRNGGVLDGFRLLGRKTVSFMVENHLPGSLCDLGSSQFTSDLPSEDGLGFGLGFAVVLDPCRTQVVGSAGEYFWAGVGGTHFWIDPKEDLIVIQMAQMKPASLVPMRKKLRALVYQALV